MGYNQEYKSINLCPEPCSGEGGVWNRWLNIPYGVIAPILVTDMPPSILYTHPITESIQSAGGQWTLRGNFILEDDIGAGAGIEITFDFGGTSYTATVDIPMGEDNNLVEFELKVEDLDGSARLSECIIWVRGRVGGTEPVEISMPDLPFGPIPQPDYILSISAICTTGDCIFTWASLIGEAFV